MARTNIEIDRETFQPVPVRITVTLSRKNLKHLMSDGNLVSGLVTVNDCSVPLDPFKEATLHVVVEEDDASGRH